MGACGEGGPDTGAEGPTSQSTDAQTEEGEATTSSATSDGETSSETSAAETAGTSVGDSGPSGEAVGFDVVSPIYNQKCGPCHVNASFGGHNLGSGMVSEAYEDSQRAASSATCAGLTKGACSLIRIQSGSMPMGLGCTGDPAADVGNDACLTTEEQGLLQTWIDDGQQGPGA